MAASPDIQKTTRWGIVWLTIGAGIVVGLQVGKVPPAIPLLRDDLGLSLVAAGWVASLFNVVGAALGVLVGIFTDRIGARRVMLTCLMALTLGSFAGGLATTGTWLLAGRALESLGFVGITVAGPRLIVAAAQPGDHGRALGTWGIYMPTGFAAAMIAAPALLALGGWQLLWFAGAAISLAFVIAMAALTTRSRWPDAPQPWRSGGLADIAATLARPGPWLLAACFALYTIQWFAMMAWLPTFLIDAQGWSAADAALGGALVVGSNIAGNLLAGWLLYRGWPRWVLIAIAYAAMLSCGAGVFAAIVPADAKLALAIAFSAIGGLLPGAVLAGAATHAPGPAQVGMTSGAIVQGANVGSLVGPPALAVLAAAVGWQAGWWLLVACGSAGLAVSLVLRAVEARMGQASSAKVNAR